MSSFGVGAESKIFKYFLDVICFFVSRGVHGIIIWPNLHKCQGDVALKWVFDL